MQESRHKQTDLSDEEPDLIAVMVTFFYDKSSIVKDVPTGNPVQVQEALLPMLIDLTQLYLLADKYFIRGLRTASYDHFALLARRSLS